MSVKTDVASILLCILFALLQGSCKKSGAAEEMVLLNVSYDATRELYDEVNASFTKKWSKEHGGQNLSIRQSHGGSGKQTRSVMEGLEADVVTLALAYDVDRLRVAHLIDEGWERRLSHNSSPITSTIVFVVRKGNPKSVRDWSDLTRPGLSVITPNPKTGGGARWNFLAAYGYSLRTTQGDEHKAEEFVRALFANVPVLDTGARSATTTFAERGLGDVLIAWENEALLLQQGHVREPFEIVRPSISILAEPSVAVVDRYVDKHRTREVAEAYLQFLFTDEGQEIVAKHYYRPRTEAARAKHASLFPDMLLFTVDELFGGWAKAQHTHFDDGGTFDRIYTPRR